MANNSQSSGQFRPVLPAQQGQTFIPAPCQQFRPVGPGIPPSNVGMPAFQPMQQFPHRLGQTVHSAIPSSQAIPAPYGQTNRLLTAGSPYSQHTTPAMNNHVWLRCPWNATFFIIYICASPYGQPQNNLNAPVAGQPWMSSTNQGTSFVTPVHQTGQQVPVASSADTAAPVPSNSQPSSSDWQEHTASDGRRYFYNKQTKQSCWEKPVELMTPIETSWQVWRNLTAVFAHFDGGLSLS